MNRYIDLQYRRIGSIRQRLISAVSLLLVSSLMLSSASFAWLTISRAPEVANVASNVGANGNLEIALGKNIGESAVGDSFDKNEVTEANRTWGNLIDLSDSSYGLQEIVLLPAMLNAAGGAVNTLHPFAFPVYSEDGRIERLYANNVFAGTFNGTWFTTSVNDYGVRGIGATLYNAPGKEGTFGSLSQRQELLYQAYQALNSSMMRNSYALLCRESQSVLMAYCRYGTGVSAAELNLNDFYSRVNAVISAANEDLRVIFTAFAAAEMTPAEDYFLAMELLQEQYPEYEIIQPLLDTAIQAMGAAEVGDAIAELRDFQGVADHLKEVIASGEVNGSDGYSMEEIARTVGLVFDLERTSFTEDGEKKSYYYYSKLRPDLVYHRYTVQIEYMWYWQDSYDATIYALAKGLRNKGDYQDNDSRVDIANNVSAQMYSISESLRLADLDQAIAGLYVSHWNYWEEHAEEYQCLLGEVEELEPHVTRLEGSVAEQQGELERITKEIETLEQQLAEATDSSARAEIQNRLTEMRTQASSSQNNLNSLEAEYLPKAAELLDKKTQLQTLMDEKIYAADDSHLEAVRSVMQDTIEAMRKYTLWSIAYFACDGQVPDDAYHRMQEIANSSEYIHPRTAYRALCNYGVTPANELTQMVEAYEMLEQKLQFLQRESGDEDEITWAELNTELQRVFGTITQTFSFRVVIGDSDSRSYAYNSSYSPEDIFAPTEVMTKIREEIQKCKDFYANLESSTQHSLSYSHKFIYDSADFNTNEENHLWEQALGLLKTFYDAAYPFEYDEHAQYILEDVQFETERRVNYTSGFWFGLSIGVGSEENFNESGLTVRQTRFQTAQESISGHQNALITAAVNMDKDMVTLLTQMIAGQDSVSLTTISGYLTALQQQVDHAEAMMYQAALAMAASDYANDRAYSTAYSYNAPKDAAGLIALLKQNNFDEKVLMAFDHRMELLNNQKASLNQSAILLKNYQDPATGALTAEQIPSAEAAAMLNPVLDTADLNLYGYVKEEQEQDGKNGSSTRGYLRTVLYDGFGSPSVQINGSQVTIGNREPITVFGDVYLTLGRSLSGGLLALAKTQVEAYTPPAGNVSAEDIAKAENGTNRQFYTIGTGEKLYTMSLRTADAPYTLATDLWTYTGNTNYISANQVLIDLYGYCIDLSLRTNAETSDLLLQTEAANRVYNDGETLTDKTMGAGSHMEFTTEDPSYSPELAREYMSCIRVAITDTNTGYIYGYASLDMSRAEVIGTNIKAPLRLHDKDTGRMLEGDAGQYICRMDQNMEKNLTVYVYLDGAKTTDAVVSAVEELSLHGVLNLQFCSSADLKPVVMEDMR